MSDAKRMKKKALKCLGSLTVILAGLFLLQRLVTEKYMDDFVDSAAIGDYYFQEHDHDVLFIGDCEVSTAFSPPYLWKEYGIHSYSRGCLQQTIWQSCYLLKEMLEEEKPKVVVCNVLSMKYEEAVRSEYNRINLDEMKWSKNKWLAVRESLTEEESILEYLFPILYYHERWKTLKREDFQYLTGRKENSLNGFFVRTAQLAYEKPEKAGEGHGGRFGQKAYAWLDEIRKLCAARDVQLILVKGPGILPEWYPEWEQQMEEYAQRYQLPYVNLIEKAEEIGIDYRTDTFSGGRHMNVYGAEKVSAYLGRILQEEYRVPDRRSDAALAESWEEKLRIYEEKKKEGSRDAADERTGISG